MTTEIKHDLWTDVCKAIEEFAGLAYVWPNTLRLHPEHWQKLLMDPRWRYVGPQAIERMEFNGLKVVIDPGIALLPVVSFELPVKRFYTGPG